MTNITNDKYNILRADPQQNPTILLTYSTSCISLSNVTPRSLISYILSHSSQILNKPPQCKLTRLNDLSFVMSSLWFTESNDLLKSVYTLPARTSWSIDPNTNYVYSNKLLFMLPTLIKLLWCIDKCEQINGLILSATNNSNILGIVLWISTDLCIGTMYDLHFHRKDPSANDVWKAY